MKRPVGIQIICRIKVFFKYKSLRGQSFTLSEFASEVEYFHYKLWFKNAGGGLQNRLKECKNPKSANDFRLNSGLILLQTQVLENFETILSTILYYSSTYWFLCERACTRVQLRFVSQTLSKWHITNSPKLVDT